MDHQSSRDQFISPWRTKPLSACIEKVKISTKIPRSSFQQKGEIPIISQEAEFINGYWDNEADAIRVNDPLVIFGDHTQVLKLIDFDFVVGADGVKILKPKEFLDAAFLRFFLEAYPLPSLGYARHFRHISGLEVPLPPLEEQKRIVTVLDQAFAALDRARAHAHANLADAEELFQAFKASLMEHPEGVSEEVSLAEVASIETKLVDPRKPLYLDLPHVGAGNMITGSDTLVDVLTAREEKLKSGKHPFDSQTVLYSKIRPYLMKVARPIFSGICSADVYPLTPGKKLDRNYLFHLLLSPHFTEFAVSGSDRAGMPKVNRSHLFSYKFALPEVDMQRDISARIDLAMQLRQSLGNAFSAKLTDIADLRHSLLQKAFSGQLTA